MLKHALLTQLQEYNNGKGGGELNMRSRGRTNHVLSRMFNFSHCCSDCSNNISFFQVNKLTPKIKKKNRKRKDFAYGSTCKEVTLYNKLQSSYLRCFTK